MQKSASKSKKKNPKNQVATAPKKKAGKGKASHDQPYPPKLVDFMLSGWKSPSGVMPKPIKNAAARL